MSAPDDPRHVEQLRAVDAASDDFEFALHGGDRPRITLTLSYDYRAATVWLEPLAAEGHPMTHDLCDRHGARTAAPRGWELVDRRLATAQLAS